MNRRNVAIALGVFLTVLLVIGCAPSPHAALENLSLEHRAGFFHGFWHGLISPITFIISLFNADVGVYDVFNNGHWYDFGYLLGAATTFGSGARNATRKKGK